MQKETNHSFWNQRTNHLRHEHEMVVVNPDDIAELIDFCNGVSEDLVDLLIVFPCLFFVLGFVVVVELVVEGFP